MKTVQEFVNALNAAFAARFSMDIRALGAVTFELKLGRKYDKVVSGGAVYCFVDKEGNIYKAAGWAAPARGVRATLEQMTPEFLAEIAKAGYASTAWLYIR